jgi:P27 family predicted phage terminase small subunit
MAKKPKPPLKLVTAADATSTGPPRDLDSYGRSLWDRIMREYDIQDAGGVELLLLACEGIDRIRALRQEIERDGAVIRLRNGAIREHPALKAEIAAMSFVTRTLARLGLDVEPVRPSRGRPGAIGWQG